jgi:hypothetical protein
MAMRKDPALEVLDEQGKEVGEKPAKLGIGGV